MNLLPWAVPPLTVDQDAALMAAIALVRAHGLDVQAVPGDVRWLKPIEIARANGLPDGCVVKRLHQQECPRFTALRGPKGAIAKVWPAPDVVTFLSRPLDPSQVRCRG